MEPCFWPDLDRGFSGDGECFNHSFIRECDVAKSFLNGGRGGAQHLDGCCDGGFGGGGAPSGDIPGGGGGYSGGSVNGSFKGVINFAPGGGGSFVPRSNEAWNAETGACDIGDGYVTFHFLGCNSP